MDLKNENFSTKTISKADLIAMEGRTKKFTKHAIKTIPDLSEKELKILDNEVSASGKELSDFLKEMEQKMK